MNDSLERALREWVDFVELPVGVTTEDHVENQVVLFRLDRPVTLSLRVQLIDAAVAVAATHQFP